MTVVCSGSAQPHRAGLARLGSAQMYKRQAWLSSTSCPDRLKAARLRLALAL